MYSVPYIAINLGFCKKKFGLFDIFTLASTGKESSMGKQLKRCQFFKLLLFLLFINIAIVECLP